MISTVFDAACDGNIIYHTQSECKITKLEVASNISMSVAQDASLCLTEDYVSD